MTLRQHLCRPPLTERDVSSGHREAPRLHLRHRRAEAGHGGVHVGGEGRFHGYPTPEEPAGLTCSPVSGPPP